MFAIEGALELRSDTTQSETIGGRWCAKITNFRSSVASGIEALAAMGEAPGVICPLAPLSEGPTWLLLLTGKSTSCLPIDCTQTSATDNPTYARGNDYRAHLGSK
jgi:hypothetical protein